MKFRTFNYEKVTSTNDVAIKLIMNKNVEQGLVFSKFQSNGRGSKRKKWISKKGNLFVSLFFQLKKNYPTVKEFTLINPLLNIDIIKDYCGLTNTFYKPPNDIYIEEKKVCGILQEVITKKKNKYLIVGIGMNVVSNPDIKNYPSTNIYNETNKKYNLFKLNRKIIERYEKFFNNIEQYNFLEFEIKSKKIILN